jgi:hypothetical protein
MCLLWGTNWVFISQMMVYFIVTTVKTSNLTKYFAKNLIYFTVDVDYSFYIYYAKTALGLKC